MRQWLPFSYQNIHPIDTVASMSHERTKNSWLSGNYSFCASKFFSIYITWTWNFERQIGFPAAFKGLVKLRQFACIVAKGQAGSLWFSAVRRSPANFAADLVSMRIRHVSITGTLPQLVCVVLNMFRVYTRKGMRCSSAHEWQGKAYYMRTSLSAAAAVGFWAFCSRLFADVYFKWRVLAAFFTQQEWQAWCELLWICINGAASTDGLTCCLPCKNSCVSWNSCFEPSHMTLLLLAGRQLFFLNSVWV